MKALNKTCGICKKTLDIKFFHKRGRNVAGYKPNCKLCMNTRTASKKFNIDKYYEINGKYYLRRYKSYIRDTDEATGDIREVFKTRGAKLIDVWRLKESD